VKTLVVIVQMISGAQYELHALHRAADAHDS
jgi:hypothetical protein